ncbi:MAG: hypothetical protein QM754_07880 [Tepidisphaeraceae bacterium]
MHCSAGWLRRITERAIRTHHHESFIEHQCHTTYRPVVRCLRLCRRKSLLVFFTVERQIVVRGYGWTVMSGPFDDQDCGVIFSPPGRY